MTPVAIAMIQPAPVQQATVSPVSKEKQSVRAVALALSVSVAKADN